MTESPTRWKANNLPRQGWKLLDVCDENYGQECDWCGTSIRYVHYIYHSEIDLQTQCGCVCAEHLTKDYITGRKRENELRQRKTKIHTFINSPRWERSIKTYNLYRKDKMILIYKKDDYFMLKIKDLWGKKKYPSENEAKIAAFNYISREK